MTESGSDRWLGREDVAWNILLAAHLQDVPTVIGLRERLAQVFAREGWPTPPEDGVLEGRGASLLTAIAELRDPRLPVSLGLAPDSLLLRGHHAHVDGLGLLAVLRDVATPDLVSNASGVRDRQRRSTVATMAARLTEAVARPPAGVHGLPERAETDPPDVFADVTLARHVGTAELAHAVVQSLVAHNRASGGRDHRIALAVGVSTVGGRDLRVADDSGFLRVTNAERLDRDAMTRILGSAPLQVGGTARTTSAHRAAPLIRWASQALASRLGSTVLVSHLGRVEASGLTGLAFYPLAGNGSGLSVGAATVAGRTVVTLRARGSQHGPTDLEDLLDAIATRLR